MVERIEKKSAGRKYIVKISIYLFRPWFLKNKGVSVTSVTLCFGTVSQVTQIQLNDLVRSGTIVFIAAKGL